MKKVTLTPEEVVIIDTAVHNYKTYIEEALTNTKFDQEFKERVIDTIRVTEDIKKKLQ